MFNPQNAILNDRRRKQFTDAELSNYYVISEYLILFNFDKEEAIHSPTPSKGCIKKQIFLILR